MYKEILRGMTGVELAPLVSFIIFFGFFLLLIVYVAVMPKAHVKNMENLPLDEQNVPSTTTDRS